MGNNYKTHISLLLYLTKSLIFSVTDVSCLRNVMLTVIPTPVQKGRRVELHCSYDLENATLYSVKFYRGTHEFYRYSPSDHPTQKFFKHDKFPQVVDVSIFVSVKVIWSPWFITFTLDCWFSIRKLNARLDFIFSTLFYENKSVRFDKVEF